MAAAPSRFRRRATHPCTTFAHDAGRSSPHSASASASVLLGSPARTTSAESTTRSRGLEPVGLAVDLERAEHGDTHAPTVDLALDAVNRADTRLIPDRQAGDTRGRTPGGDSRPLLDERRTIMRHDQARSRGAGPDGQSSPPAATTTQRPTRQPTSQQTTSARPRRPPECQAVGFHHDELAPGCWAIQVRGLPDSPLAELDLPAGFSGNDAWVWVNADEEDEWGAITLMPVGDVYPDPCARAGNPPKVGPSVEDFATALAAQKVTTSDDARPGVAGRSRRGLPRAVRPGRLRLQQVP